MSVGPVSGNGVAITLPPGKTAIWTVTTQAAYNQYVRLNDSTGATVFQATGASPGGHSPNQIGEGTFVVSQNGAYTLYVGVNGGQQWSQVIWDEITVSLGATMKCGNFNFISEDGADQDFNDSCVSITWFNSIG